MTRTASTVVVHSTVRPIQDTYLSLLRWDSPLHIVVISGLLLSPATPFPQEALIVVLFVGMVIRSRMCAVRPPFAPASTRRGLVLLVPLWPALVTVDDVWSWMQRVGFGPAFRTGVTATLFAVCWLPFVDATSQYHLLALLGAGFASSLLRERREGYWYLAPSVIPIGIVGAPW